MLGKLPEMPEDATASLEQALSEARKDVIQLRKMRREGRGLGEVSEDADMTYLNPSESSSSSSSSSDES